MAPRARGGEAREGEAREGGAREGEARILFQSLLGDVFSFFLQSFILFSRSLSFSMLIYTYVSTGLNISSQNIYLIGVYNIS